MSGKPVAADRLARFMEMTDVSRETQTLEEMFQRMTSVPEGVVGMQPEGLPAICAAWGVPYGRVLAWLMGEDKRYAMYLRALEIAAHALVGETVAIADNESPFTQRDRLRVQTRFQVARHHASKLYGEQLEIKHSGEITMSMALSQIAAKRLREGTLRVEKDVTPSIEGVGIEVQTADDI